MVANQHFMMVASIEDVFPIIFIIAVFLNFILRSARKKVIEKQQGDSQEDGEGTRPRRPAMTSGEQELQDFLQSLTGRKPAPPSQQTVSPLATAAPVVVPPPAPSAARITSRPKQSRARATQVPPPPPSVRKRKTRPAHAVKPTTPDKKKKGVGIDELRIKLAMDLVGRNSLKKAILLKEVLGQPLGMSQRRLSKY